ncbi:hypothetical protein D3C75_871200 [compost metagenome]
MTSLDVTDLVGQHPQQLLVALGQLHQLVGEDHRARGQRKGVGAQFVRRLAELEPNRQAAGRHQRREAPAQARLLRGAQFGSKQHLVVEQFEYARADLPAGRLRQGEGADLGQRRNAVAHAAPDEGDGHQQAEQHIAQAGLQPVDQAVALALAAQQPVDAGVVGGLEGGAVGQAQHARRVAEARADDDFAERQRPGQQDVARGHPQATVGGDQRGRHRP